MPTMLECAVSDCEQVAVWVDDCFAFKCPKHKAPPGHEWRDIARKMARARKEELASWDGIGWHFENFFVCDAAKDPRGVAEHVLAVLSSRQPLETKRRTNNKDDLEYARLARIDTASRVGIHAWHRIVQLIAQLQGKTFKMNDVSDS